MTLPDLACPLAVVALGGNAISPPRGALSLAGERQLIDRAMDELAALARDGWRLLIVHGNGPQVGRLLAAPGIGDAENLDVHVAQTQGELGYLLAEALDARLGGHAAVALVTRVLVDPADPAFAHPTKPVGAVLAEPPAGLAAERTPEGSGWRRVVASPHPAAVVELDAVRALLESRHVIAGGGGGVALAGSLDARRARPAVIDKDWVAALFAVALDAAELLFVTDVPTAFDGFGSTAQEPIGVMTAAEAHVRLARGTFAPGSMQPKVESALRFVQATGRRAVITTIGAVGPALRGAAGTTIHP